MVIYVHAWFRMLLYAPVWSCMGYVWCCMVFYDLVWSGMVLYGLATSAQILGLLTHKGVWAILFIEGKWPKIEIFTRDPDSVHA